LARALLLAGWGAGAVSLLNPQQQPFSALMIVAGILIAAGGIVLPRQREPAYSWIPGGLVLIGAGWVVLGIATTAA
jgi:hypothetical protein